MERLNLCDGNAGRGFQGSPGDYSSFLGRISSVHTHVQENWQRWMIAGFGIVVLGSRLSLALGY